MTCYMMFTNKHKYFGLLYIEMYYYTYYTYTLKKSISKHIETKCTPPSPSKKKEEKKKMINIGYSLTLMNKSLT